MNVTHPFIHFSSLSFVLYMSIRVRNEALTQEAYSDEIGNPLSPSMIHQDNDYEAPANRPAVV